VGLTTAELVAQTGVPETDVERLVALGILSERDEPEAFDRGDVHLVRLIMACDRAGLPLDGIAAAVREGRLSLGFFDSLADVYPIESAGTFGPLCERHGVDAELARRAYEAAGLAGPAIEDPVTANDDAIMGGLALAGRLGLDGDVAIRAMRGYGDNVRRIAELERERYHQHIEGPLLAMGMSEVEMREMAMQVSTILVPTLDRLLLALYHQHQTHERVEHLVQHIEAELERGGVIARRPTLPPAMCFLDLTGFTRLTEERGDAFAANLATSMAAMTHAVASRYQGRPIKWLGDGMMFHFDRPESAVVASLEMIDGLPSAGLPPAHVGISAGPVVHQDGDYFGRTVNLAARIAGRAEPNEVLVSEEVVEACVPSEPERRRFESLGPVELKGFERPIPLYRVVPGSS
jgi:adenylate cyclase